MFAEDISEDFSEDRRYHIYWILEHFWISLKCLWKITLFGEVFCEFLASGFLPLSRFQVKGKERRRWPVELDRTKNGGKGNRPGNTCKLLLLQLRSCGGGTEKKTPESRKLGGHQQCICYHIVRAGIRVLCLLRLTKVMFVSNISDTTTPPLPPTP